MRFRVNAVAQEKLTTVVTARSHKQAVERAVADFKSSGWTDPIVVETKAEPPRSKKGARR
jgi:hypothetical protein